ncbi:hypothetical protein Cni_G11197 [Canna indica]|uniref:Uncharacterized protein n=1 Tax=Canna indica TaxID=4628 RepID=A0AAQ3K9R3_9LILI|nr:hypothetical protein Cni_G11197 [Canna indica]
METAKHRGSKGKSTTSFYRVPKPTKQYTTKIIPTQTPPSVSLGFHAKDQPIILSTKPKHSSVIKKGIGSLNDYDNIPNSTDSISEVDKRAANFISYVQERFRLERTNDEWRELLVSATYY